MANISVSEMQHGRRRLASLLLAAASALLLLVSPGIALLAALAAVIVGVMHARSMRAIDWLTIGLLAVTTVEILTIVLFLSGSDTSVTVRPISTR